MSEIKKIATRVSYGNALAELGEIHKDICVLDADLAASTQTAIFGKRFPDRFFDVGIQEGNMVGVAAGLATTGKTVFCSSFAMFATGRAYEIIRNSVAYPRLNVKICSDLPVSLLRSSTLRTISLNWARALLCATAPM